MNIMIDLETLDVRPSSVILSVGIVVFDDKKIVEAGYLIPNRQQQIDAGRTISFDTLKWHLKQGAECQAVFSENDQMTVEECITAIHATIIQYPNAKIWSNGANFDAVIMDHLFNMYSVEAPYKFWNVRCFRTYCEEKGEKYSGKSGVTHNALQDAKDQANHLIQIWNKTTIPSSFKIGARR